jgi:hypothetical protein
MTAVLLVAVSLFLAAQQAPPRRPEPPKQPIPYSHKAHDALGLTCNGCHPNRDPGESMGIPETSLCMGCHKTTAADKPAIKTLATYAAENRRVPWVRVYRIPGYVFFSHREHLKAGAKCETCHGPVAEREALFRESDISMGGCMDCHRRHEASNECTYCHDPR